MKTKYDVEFYFGVRPVSTFNLYVTAIFLSLAVNILSRYTKGDEKNLWAIIDEVGRHYNISLINKLITSVPELLSDRINREIDKAIEDYPVVSDNSSPIFTEIVDGETPLGGEMRIQSPWETDTTK